MPFKSQAQRRFMYAKHPELAEEFEAATPKGKKLPEKVVKKAYDDGIIAALNRYGVKEAGEEVRLQIPRRQYHGYDEAWRSAKRNEGTKAADCGSAPLEPQAAPDAPAEQLAQMLQQLDEDPNTPALEATKDPLDRATLWGSPSNLNARDNVNGVESNMGQDTSVGQVW